MLRRASARGFHSSGSEPLRWRGGWSGSLLLGSHEVVCRNAGFAWCGMRRGQHAKIARNAGWRGQLRLQCGGGAGPIRSARIALGNFAAPANRLRAGGTRRQRLSRANWRDCRRGGLGMSHLPRRVPARCGAVEIDRENDCRGQRGGGGPGQVPAGEPAAPGRFGKRLGGFVSQRGQRKRNHGAAFRADG